MSLRTRLLAAFAVVFTSAPAFACHRHLFFWHGCRETPAPAVAVAPMVVPLPVPHVVPVPVVLAAPPPPRVVYVQAEEAPLPPPPMVVAPVVVAPAPPPPPAPVVVVQPRPVVAAAPVVVAQPQLPPEEPVKRIALKYAPGISAVLDTEAKEFGPASFTNSIGAEFRLSRYFALRGDVELRQGSRSWQIPGLKVSLFPSSRVHPFASASLMINQVDNAPANRVSLGFMAAAGLDITVFRWLFLTAEARYQVQPGNCCALPRVAGLVGVGVQFF